MKLVLRSEIRKARPSLSIASPLTFWLCIGYVGLNMALGYVIYTVPDAAHLAVYQIASQHVLGGAFAFLSVVLLLSLAMNSWKGTRITLGLGLFLKCLYAYSLIDLGMRIGFEQINGVMAVWLALVWVQFCTIVFFAPPLLNGGSHAK